MKKLNWTLVFALTSAFLAGALARDLFAPAYAHADAPAAKGYEYKVVGASMGPGGYEEDLTKFGSQGWRFAGEVATHLVFERAKK